MLLIDFFFFKQKKTNGQKIKVPKVYKEGQKKLKKVIYKWRMLTDTAWCWLSAEKTIKF